MGFWAYSFGRIFDMEFRLGRTRVGILSVDGKLSIAIASHAASIPYWFVWVVVAVITVVAEARFRAPRTRDLRR
jgi:hypothetical protein